MKKSFIVITVLVISLAGNSQKFLQGSIRKATNPDGTKVEILLRPNYTSGSDEFIFFMQLAVSIPVKFSEGVSATAEGVNAFSKMGILAPISPYTETFGTESIDDDEQVFGFTYINPTATAQSWVSGKEFAGVEVTFSKSIAAHEVKMLNLTNRNGGLNINTYFSIVSTAGDISNYGELYYEMPGVNQLGKFPDSGDQYVQTPVSRKNKPK